MNDGCRFESADDFVDGGIVLDGCPVYGDIRHLGHAAIDFLVVFLFGIDAVVRADVHDFNLAAHVMTHACDIVSNEPTPSNDQAS